MSQHRLRCAPRRLSGRRRYRVLRFWNNELTDNFDGVVETIFNACAAAAASQETDPC